MLRSANEFGVFRIVNHGISGEEILSVVNEVKFVLEYCNKGVDDRSWVEEGGNRETIFQVWRRNDSEVSENTVVQAETYRQIRYRKNPICLKMCCDGLGLAVTGLSKGPIFSEMFLK